VRDNGAAVRQLGFDRHEVARAIAAKETAEQVIVAPTERDLGRSSAQISQAESLTINDWACSLYRDLFAQRRFDRVNRYYADEAVIHASGGRTAEGTRNIQRLFIHLLSAISDSEFRVDNVCHSDETDGVIVAVRWVLEGRTASGGFLGQCPLGQLVRMMGISHLRLVGPKVVEEWMLFDEIGVLVQAYRQ
jgi:predicted ester cyclase